MEPSQLIGSPEECSSNESGWTMYISSPMHGRDADDDGAGGVVDDKVVLVDDNASSGDDDSDGGDHDPSSSHGSSSSSDDDDATGEDSDDSMASDASSGPGRVENFYGCSGRYSAGKGENIVEDEGYVEENGRNGCPYKKIYRGKKTETMKKKKKKKKKKGVN
ncbi:hypothetical protein H6P81_008615 [Aristolochia fimbriata]|uniref:Uncharacterized protein n=1 Tax=Aristolochia fimbriata TaxID=158543 RepID=A0AAV7EII1_ARIFI|nr:hypothetical protein H6P81_008615 [Aristolochia fimbriata]